MPGGYETHGHILLVEDDASALFALTSRLEYAGYRVTQAASGELAVDLLERETFDVVLTDIVLGDVDGIEVLLTARRAPAAPQVVLLTGHGTLETSVAALRAGAYDYLLKPVSEEDLLACMAGAMQRHRQNRQMNQLMDAARYLSDLVATRPSSARAVGASAPTPYPLRVGALTIGASRQEVWLHNAPLHTTPIEYALLHYLAEHEGMVCSCCAIVRSTHGFETSETEAQNLLRSHVRNLRKKLGAEYIINDRGTGYMLVNPHTPAICNE